MYFLEPMSATPISSLYESACRKLPASSASLQYTPIFNFEESQIAMYGDADDAGRQWSDQDERTHLLVLKKPALISFQAKQPKLYHNYIGTDCLSVFRPLEFAAWLGSGGNNLCLLSNVRSLVTWEVSIRVHGLWLPQSSYGTCCRS